MERHKIPVLLLPLDTCGKLGRRFRKLGLILAKVNPKLGMLLKKADIDIDGGSYAVGSFFSSFLYGIIFLGIALAALSVRSEETENAGALAYVVGLSVWSVFFMLHMIYPGIIVKKIAAKESKELLFGLRELMMDVDSGVTLFQAMKNVGGSGYGYVSEDFLWLVEQIENGIPERDAIRLLALKTESEFLKRALWQIVNALETGTSVKTALGEIAEALERHTYRDIKDYSSSLNFLMLIYMMTAAVLPSLGITFLVLLSAFSDLGVDVNTISMLVGASAVMQVVMIGYMSATRPEVFGG